MGAGSTATKSTAVGCSQVLGAESTCDVRRILGCMDDGEYVNALVIERIEDQVWERVRECAPNARLDPLGTTWD